MKRFLVPFAIILVAASSLAIIKYRQTNSDRANLQRLQSLRSNSWGQGPKKHVVIALWVFRTGTIMEAENWEIEGIPQVENLSDRAFFQQIEIRTRYLDSIQNIDFSNVRTKTGAKSPNGKKKWLIFTSIGVEAVPVIEKGSTKYRAVNYCRTGGVLSADIDKPFKLPEEYKVARREDFVNPEDVDWMFGVQDFTKIKVSDIH